MDNAQQTALNILNFIAHNCDVEIDSKGNVTAYIVPVSFLDQIAQAHNILVNKKAR